jgi:hypothetical protein
MTVFFLVIDTFYADFDVLIKHFCSSNFLLVFKNFLNEKNNSRLSIPQCFSLVVKRLWYVQKEMQLPTF